MWRVLDLLGDLAERAIRPVAFQVQNVATASPQAKERKRKAAGKTCNARTKSGGYCGKGAGQGTDHVGIGRCSLHGGSTPLHVKGAEMEQARRQEAELREVVNSLALPVEVDPLDALLEELARTNGMVHWLSLKVSSLQEQREDGLQGSEMIGPVGGASGGIPEWKPSVWIAMWEAERAHLAKVAKLCLDAGIDEKRIRLAEQQGQMIVSVIQAFAVKMGLDLEAPKARTALREALSVVNGEGRELPA